MSELELIEYVIGTFPGVHTANDKGNTFFFYEPEGEVPEKMFPFATLVTNDSYDTASDLTRPGVYRLNMGVSRETFRLLFGQHPPADEAPDYTALDRLMPHPVYWKMNWICVLNPRNEIFEKVKELLRDAYDSAVQKRSGRAS